MYEGSLLFSFGEGGGLPLPLGGKGEGRNRPSLCERVERQAPFFPLSLSTKESDGRLPLSFLKGNLCQTKKASWRANFLHTTEAEAEAEAEADADAEAEAKVEAEAEAEANAKGRGRGKGSRDFLNTF